MTGPPAEPIEPIDPPDNEQFLAVERWFIERGLPHFVERKTDGSALDAWTRALPLLVIAYLALGFQALDLQNWTLGENLATAVVVLVVLIGTWAVSNRLRGSSTFARPSDIDAPELALFVIGPTIPVLLFGQVGDAVETVIGAGIILILIYLWSSYGLGPLTRWGVRRTLRQLNELTTLVARALPLLLLFNAFLFINAEVWEVAGTLVGWAFWLTLATFFALGTAFSLSRVPRIVREVSTFSTWDDVDELLTANPAGEFGTPTGRIPDDPPTVRQKANIALLVLFGPALQITLVAVTIFAFFVGFGTLAISADTALNWTRLDEIEVIAEFFFDGEDRFITEPLLRVSAFLAAFSGMYFTVVLSTDDAYRREFEDEAGPTIREALAARAAYREARRTLAANASNSDNGVA